MPDLSVGVIGLGLGRQFAAAFAGSDRVERLVLCDLDEQRITEVRSSLPKVTRGYADVNEMVANERLDAVAVVSPDQLHRPHSEACLRAGYHVLQTKPLATDLDDARAIVRAAEGSGRVLMVAHERRFRTRVRAIKSMLERDELGQIIHVRIDAIQDKRAQFRHSPWYASTEAGRTALVGSGIHEVDLLRFFVGEPIESVVAFSNRLGLLEFPKDKTTAALYRFKGGAIGQVTVTYEAHWPNAGSIDDHFRLIGTKGMIVGNRVATDARGEWETLPGERNEMAASVRGCVAAFLDTVIHGAPNPMGGREAFASLAACVAADESAASGELRKPAPEDFP